MHSDQWRYDHAFGEMCPVDRQPIRWRTGTPPTSRPSPCAAAGFPAIPSSQEHNFELVRDAEARGRVDPVEHVVVRLKERTLKFAMEDPDNPANASPACGTSGAAMRSRPPPRATSTFSSTTSARTTTASRPRSRRTKSTMSPGTTSSSWARWTSSSTSISAWTPRRLYSDIVLPTATWYEKDDLSSTDMHSFIHPLQAAFRPAGNRRATGKSSEGSRSTPPRWPSATCPKPVQDIVATPLLHDTPGEIAQPSIKDWAKGECEAIPGKTMPNLKVVERDYTKIYQKFISLGPNFRDNGLERPRHRICRGRSLRQVPPGASRGALGRQGLSFAARRPLRLRGDLALRSGNQR
jgi:nitrate reductase alpha subunit